MKLSNNFEKTSKAIIATGQFSVNAAVNLRQSVLNVNKF